MSGSMIGEAREKKPKPLTKKERKERRKKKKLARLQRQRA
jgi:hypothetical protein